MKLFRSRTSKLMLLLAATAMHSYSAMAQANASGNTGLTEATKAVSGYFKSGTNLMYAIGAIVGIVGAIKVYQKWNAGEQDTGKVAAAWFGSCVFLLVVAAILRGFFDMPA